MKIIIGLPGSGREYLANKLSNETSQIIYEPLSVSEILEDKSLDLNNIILIDSTLCLPENRADFLAKLYFLELQFEVFYFENNPRQCKINSFHYPNKIKDINILSPIYEIPVTQKTLKIYA